MIADFDVTEQMLRHFIQKVHQNRWAHPRVVVCVPSGVTGVEKRAVEEACLSAGARQAYLIEEPMAAAIGAGLPVGEPTGNMVVDIGGGTSEVAVISLGGIVVSQSIRIGGDELDEAIINYVKREYKLMIGQQTAEEVKLEIGSAFPLDEEMQAEIRGRDLVSGLPKTIVLTSEEVRLALEEPLQAIIDAVKETLDRTPAGAGLGHHGPGHHARRRRRAAAGARRAPARRDADARAPGRVPAHVRGGRVRPQPRGVRGHPPQQQEFPKQPAPLSGSGSRRSPKCSTARWSAADGRRWRSSSPLSMVMLTAYFGESGGGVFHALQRGAQEAFAPIETGASRALKPVRDLVGWFGDTLDAKGENEELKNEVEDAARSASARRDRPARRRAAARAGGARARRRLPAGHQPRRRARDRPLADRLVLEREDRQGLERRRAQVDQPVIAAGGLAGKVTQVTGGTAEVTLITDASSAVSAQVMPNGANGIVKPEVGKPDDLLLDFVEKGRRVTEGTTVVTSGFTSRRGRGVAVPARHPDRPRHAGGPRRGRALPARAHQAVRRPAPGRLRPGAHPRGARATPRREVPTGEGHARSLPALGRRSCWPP